MNKMDENKFKEFLHDHILQTVCEEKLTIEAVSQKLKIEPRTFNYMKSGETMFNSATLLLYLGVFCDEEDKLHKFLEKVKEIIDEISKSDDE